MRIVKYGLLVLLCLVLLANVQANRADDKDKPKHDIKEIMDLAHKKGLAKKVVAEKASDDEKKELVLLYVDLGKNEPPKGNADSWKQKTEAVVKAVKDVEAGKAGSTKALEKAINCAGCHKTHKP